MKIKDLFHLDPEAEIQVAGGRMDYATRDVEIVEKDGVAMIQESTAVRPEHYDIHDLSDTVSVDYNQLIIFKSYRSSLSELLFHFFDRAFSGTVVIDTIFSTGNNANRFIKAVVEKGKVNTKSIEIVTFERHHPVREFSNQHIQKDPDGLEASVLTSSQKKLLLKGISI